MAPTANSAKSSSMRDPDRSVRPRHALAGRHTAAMSLAAMLAIPAIGLVGCGSGDKSPAATATSTTSGAGSGASVATDPDPTKTPSSAGTGKLKIETDTGESWTLDQNKCFYRPDNKGRYVQLWMASGTLPTGEDFLVQKTTSPDPSTPDKTTIVGSIVDDAKGIVYIVIEGEAVSDGSTMTMTLGMHNSANKRVGDPIDLTATVTCSL